MNSIFKVIEKNILIFAIGLASILGFVAPSMGEYLYDLNFIPVLIFIVFVCQGTAIQGSQFSEWRHYLRGLTVGFIISQVLAPVIAFGLMQLVDWQEDYVVGFLLISCMAPTLVSGTVLTQQAKGDVTLAILLTVILNIIAVFTLPINLKLTLGAVVEVPSQELFIKLFCFVFIPSIIGYILRSKKETWVQEKKLWIKYVPIVCLSLPIFMSTAKQLDRIKAAFSFEAFLSFIVFALTEHLILFSLALIAGSQIMKISLERSRALAIVSSQKTLPITIAVWSSVFAITYPMALIPAIVFHFCQIYIDGLIVNRWNR